MKRFLLLFPLFIIVSCSGYRISSMKKSNMEKIQLNMSKSQVSDILGSSYTITEKRVEATDTIEVISYRNFPYEEEFYLFRFKNNKLEKWYREFQIKSNKENL